MLSDERVSHFASLAKYAMVFSEGVTLIGDPRPLPLETMDLGVLLRVSRCRLRELALPSGERVLAHPKPCKNLAD